VLLYSAYAGIFKAIWYGLFDTMVVMIQQTLSLADKTQCTDPNLKVFVKAIESALSAGKQMNA